MKNLLLLLITLYSGTLYAQYPPQAGIAGSTAINKSSGSFVGWASGCKLERGWKDIANKTGGFTSTGDSSYATGSVDGLIVSLGDSGVATMTFESPIYNGAGFDFAVFENGFPNPANPEEAFLELAFVEVSSDGINFTRFPASSLTPETPQVPMAGVYMTASNLNNLAGKYIAGYGTPFDLEDLAFSSSLDINHITHIRIIDVIGSTGAHASVDKDGKRINDPYPTDIPTGGFDLEAVGALYMHGKWPASVSTTNSNVFSIYPNPVGDKLLVNTKDGIGYSIALADITGKVLMSKNAAGNEIINMSEYAPGVYLLYIADKNGNKWTERIIKQ